MSKPNEALNQAKTILTHPDTTKEHAEKIGAAAIAQAANAPYYECLHITQQIVATMKRGTEPVEIMRRITNPWRRITGETTHG